MADDRPVKSCASTPPHRLHSSSQAPPPCLYLHPFPLPDGLVPCPHSSQAAPNLGDPYHTLGLLHEAMGNNRKALDFHMIAAHLTPKVSGQVQ